MKSVEDPQCVYQDQKITLCPECSKGRDFGPDADLPEGAIPVSVRVC